jgi:hypothetical protein
MEILLALASVFVLAWLNKWNERRFARRIDKAMDKAIGRED